MSPYETVWTFNTAHFAVSLDVAPEEMDPEGNFASGDDDLACLIQGFGVDNAENA